MYQPDISFNSWAVKLAGSEFALEFYSSGNCTDKAVYSSGAVPKNACGNPLASFFLGGAGPSYGGFVVDSVPPPGGGATDRLPCLCAGNFGGSTVVSEFNVSSCGDCSEKTCSYWTSQGSSLGLGCTSSPRPWPARFSGPGLEVDDNISKDCPCALSSAPVTISLLDHDTIVQLNYTFTKCESDGAQSKSAAITKRGSQFLIAPPYVIYQIGGAVLWWVDSCLYSSYAGITFPWLIVGVAAGSAALAAGTIIIIVICCCRRRMKKGKENHSQGYSRVETSLSTH